MQRTVNHTSVIELKKSALKQNLSYIRKRIGKGTQLVSVVKGNAYGHGIETFVPLAEECGADYFAVSDAWEAERVNAVKKPSSRLMIMSMIDNEDLAWAIENAISFFVFDFERLEETVKSAKKTNKKANIHLEFETGFHRNGFEEDDLEKLADFILRNQEHIIVEGVCTHYAGAESITNFVRVNNQKDLFHKMSAFFENKGISPDFYHTASSAATLTYPDTIMDMVRVGIAMYGFWPSYETRMYNLLSDDNKFTKDPLRRVIRWKSQIMNIKQVKAGEFVGYGTSYMSHKNEKLAIIPVGYAHGFSRSLSNLGHVLIRNRKAPVVGTVNMNMVTVDVTNIPYVRKGDEVVFIGKQGKHYITVASFSEMSNYVNYELLTRLPENLPRVIVK